MSAEQASHLRKTTFLDFDRDGVPNILEEVIGTDLYAADTDNDGLSDADELIFRTSAITPQTPNELLDLPTDNYQLSYYVVHAEPELRTFVMFYFPNGFQGGSDYNLSIYTLENSVVSLVDSSLVDQAISRGYLANSASTSGAQTLTIELTLSDATLQMTGQMGLLAAMHSNATLLAYDNIILLRDPGSEARGIQAQVAASDPQDPVSQYDQFPHGLSALFDPPAPEPPVSNSICVHTVQVVGVEGAVIIQEVVGAECIDGFEEACLPTECASALFSQIRTVNAVALIGG